jgi:hypothetical protein
MPNHVYSLVSVYGKENELETLKKDLKGEEKNEHISFNRVIPRPEDEKDLREWQISNWGTKWDAYAQPDEEPKILGESNSLKYIKDEDPLAVITYHFQTAWSPVPQVLEVLSRKYPQCIFKYAYLEEGEGFSGIDFWYKGELVKEKVLRPKNQVFDPPEHLKSMREFKALKIKIP